MTLITPIALIFRPITPITPTIRYTIASIAEPIVLITPVIIYTIIIPSYILTQSPITK